MENVVTSHRSQTQSLHSRLDSVMEEIGNLKLNQSQSSSPMRQPFSPESSSINGASRDGYKTPTAEREMGSVPISMLIRSLRQGTKQMLHQMESSVKSKLSSPSTYQ